MKRHLVVFLAMIGLSCCAVVVHGQVLKGSKEASTANKAKLTKQQKDTKMDKGTKAGVVASSRGNAASAQANVHQQNSHKNAKTEVRVKTKSATSQVETNAEQKHQ